MVARQPFNTRPVPETIGPMAAGAQPELLTNTPAAQKVIRIQAFITPLSLE
jgi:hypothetical protein